MIRIFVLEDDFQRIVRFKPAMIGLDYTVAMDIDEAIAKFDPPYDYIFLDHDLGGKVFVKSSDRNTGAEFVRQKGTLFAPATVVLHSMNPNGRQAMKDILTRDNGYTFPVIESPFGPQIVQFLEGLDRS